MATAEHGADERIALVTGANRGLGLEVVRQLAERRYVVYLASRDLEAGRTAARSLSPTGDARSTVRSSGPEIRPLRLDVTDPVSINGAAELLEQEAGRLDVLVNNAAIHYDTWQRATGADLGVVQEALETNVLGTWRTTQALLPLVTASDHARIVNVSSGIGSFADMTGGTPAYTVSKVALNSLTCMWADELRRHRVLVNSVCPGWVATDMGGSGGRPVDEGAAGIVWAATLPDDGPTGGFFRDGRPIPW